MRAAIRRRYGPPDVVRIEDVPTPVPGDGEVMVRVRAASVNPVDWHVLRGSPFPLRLATGWRRPKDPGLGTDVAGVVESVGARVTGLGPGDAVFGTCRGAFAEFARAPEATLVAKPEGVTFEWAACAGVAAFTALQALRDRGRVQPGQRVLVNGASGGVGTFAVQIAKALGAEVTGVCGAGNVELVRSLGADRVVDYTREDFTRGEERYDLVFDLVANHPLSEVRRVVAPGGAYLVAGVGPGRSLLGFFARWILGRPLSRLSGMRSEFVMAKATREALASLAALMAAGQVTPVIDRRFPLAEAAAAIRYVEAGHARGKVVLAVAP